MAFDPTTLAIFLAAALALNVTPGPDMLYTLGSGIGGGRRAGAAAALGIGTGTLVHAAAAAVGVSAALAASPLAFELLRWAGGGYLLWLAVQAVRRPPAAPSKGAAKAGFAAAYWRGVATNLLNPKVALFVLAFLPQFADPARGPMWLQILALGALFAGSGTLVNLGVGLGAGGVGRWLAARPRAARLQGWLSAAILALLALRLLTEGRRA